MSKPSFLDTSEMQSASGTAPALGVLTFPVRDRDISFGQASDLVVGGVGNNDGAWCLVHLSCPDRTNVGMYLLMSAEHARDTARELLRVADRLDRGGVRAQ